MKTVSDHWLEQTVLIATPSLADLRQRESELQRVTSRRNRLELAAGGFAGLFLLAMSVFALQNVGDPAELVRALGFATLPLGLLASATYFFVTGRQPAQDLAQTGLDHLIRRLRREHQLLRFASLWYVAPMLPGFAMIYAGTFVAAPEMGLFALVAGGLTALFLAWVVLINGRAARRIADELARLERAQLAGQ
jgi:uncharacterized integral membrane protein